MLLLKDRVTYDVMQVPRPWHPNNRSQKPSQLD